MTIIPADDPATRRATRGHSIRWWDLASENAAVESPHAEWFEVARRWLEDGRHRELEELTDVMESSADVASLERLAALCRFRVRVETAHADELHQVSEELRRLEPRSNAEKSVVEGAAASLSLRTSAAPDGNEAVGDRDAAIVADR